METRYVYADTIPVYGNSLQEARLNALVDFYYKFDDYHRKKYRPYDGKNYLRKYF